MPSTVASLFRAAGLKRATVAPWGRLIARPSTTPSTGIYIVALTPQLSRLDAALARAPTARRALQVLIARRADLTLDGAMPSAVQLQQRLAQFWFPDEVVVYVGLAGVRKDRPGRELPERAHDYTKTRLGAKSPHAGGWPLLTLHCLKHLHVHYAYCDNVDDTEQDCLMRFAEQVSPASRAGLHDPVHLMPFANLDYPPGTHKRHGIHGARGYVPPGSAIPW